MTTSVGRVGLLEILTAGRYDRAILFLETSVYLRAIVLLLIMAGLRLVDHLFAREHTSLLLRAITQAILLVKLSGRPIGMTAALVAGGTVRSWVLLFASKSTNSRLRLYH